jgi:Right handed beta helix region
VIVLVLATLLSMDLAPGETHLKRPMPVPKGAAHVTIRGNPAGSTLVLDPDFKGSAAIVIDSASDVVLSGFNIRGNRKELKSDWYLPTKEAAFADFYTDNGILVKNSSRVTVSNVSFQSIKAFPVLVNASSAVTLDALKIEDCGTLNRAGRNNTTGGILFEEGVRQFEVRRSTFQRITGSAIWTHSYARSPRQSDGVIRDNRIDRVGRDAIQIGHATRVRVENNTGSELGFPTEYVDIESQGIAVALDTAGNVDHTVYANNRFIDVNGQCIDLDGFHDGEVTGNSCINRKPSAAYHASHYAIVVAHNDPGVASTGITITANTLQGFAYGGLFLTGSRNRIEDNRFLDLNRAHCGTKPVTAQCNYALDQPDLLRTGIYLSKDKSVAVNNIIRANTIHGFGMKEHCIAAGPGVDLSKNTISGNSCADGL